MLVEGEFEVNAKGQVRMFIRLANAGSVGPFDVPRNHFFFQQVPLYRFARAINPAEAEMAPEAAASIPPLEGAGESSDRTTEIGGFTIEELDVDIGEIGGFEISAFAEELTPLLSFGRR